MNPNRPHFAPWDEREWPRLLSAEEGARRVRVFRQVEQRLAELLEEWAGTVNEPHLQTSLKRHARHAEWHAKLLADSLADSDGSTDADNDTASFLDAIASPKGDAEAIELRSCRKTRDSRHRCQDQELIQSRDTLPDRGAVAVNISGETKMRCRGQFHPRYRRCRTL